MKNFLFIILIIPFTGYSQNITIAHSNSVKYLLKHLNNPGSYKGVSWGKIEKVYTDYSELPKVNELQDAVAVYQNNNIGLETKMQNLKNNFHQSATFNRDSIYDETLKLKKLNDDKIDSLQKLNDYEKSKFKPVLSHYYVEHTFRTKNAYNGLMLETYVFILNKNLVVIRMDTESLDTQTKKSNEERNKIMNEVEELKKEYKH